MIAASASARGAVELKYRAAKGDVFYYSDVSRTSRTMSFKNLDERSEEQNSITLEGETTVKYHTDVLEVDGELTASMRTVPDKYLSMEGDSAIVDMDVETGRSRFNGIEWYEEYLKPYVMTADSEGKPLKFASEETAPKTTAVDFLEMSLNAFYFPMPARPVEVGEEWFEALVNSGSADPRFRIEKVRKQFQFEGIEKVKGLECAKISFSMIVESFPALVTLFFEESKLTGSPEIQRAEFVYSGTVYFAIREGFIVAVEYAINSRMSAVVSEKTPEEERVIRSRVSMDAETTGTLEIE